MDKLLIYITKRILDSINSLIEPSNTLLTSKFILLNSNLKVIYKK